MPNKGKGKSKHLEIIQCSSYWLCLLLIWQHSRFTERRAHPAMAEVPRPTSRQPLSNCKLVYFKINLQTPKTCIHCLYVPALFPSCRYFLYYRFHKEGLKSALVIILQCLNACLLQELVRLGKSNQETKKSKLQGSCFSSISLTPVCDSFIQWLSGHQKPFFLLSDAMAGTHGACHSLTALLRFLSLC